MPRYINKDALLAEYKERRCPDCDSATHAVDDCCDIPAIIRFLESAPTAGKIEPKKGEWEEEKVFDELVIEQWQSARCSVCGLYHTTPFSYYFFRYNYCPNCGAEMRKETDDDKR